MQAEIKRRRDDSIRYIEIKMKNGDIFKIEEDIEEFIQVTKEYSDKGESLTVRPRVSNQITIN